MTTTHTGDRTTGCDTCAKNDYLAEIIEQNNLEESIYESALESWVNNSPTYYLWEKWEEWYDDFEESFQGWYGSTQEFADQMADETITGELPEIAQLYFDYEKFARDLFMGDYWESNGNIFRSF